MTTHNTIAAQDLHQDVAATIIDVRTHTEHQEQSLSLPHLHVPLDQLDPKHPDLQRQLPKDATIYLLCRSGMRASQAAQRFIAAGYTNIHVIEGGITACASCGLKITRTSAATAIPLERQVRIAAGAIAAFGALAALTLDPLFACIPLLVGSGLVYAGITDRCGMALILTKAPWNKT